MFAPIAIVGRAALLPGALSPEALWQAVLDGRDLTSSAAPGRWDLDHAEIMGPVDHAPDQTWSDRGGYVEGFEQVFDPSGFQLAPELLSGMDPLFLWALHCVRAALPPGADPARAEAILGNLSFPSSDQARFAERVWLDGLLAGRAAELAGLPPASAASRFNSSGPAALLVQALGLRDAWCLDAACASSLYAIKLACDRLHDGTAELVVAGAINRADDLFIHVGFCALGALSKSGQSRPFHAQADGLLPAEGAAVVALKRLADAERDGDPIYGVIRGVGLSNDGRGRGFLAPSQAGQAAAIRQAYAQSGLTPADIGLVECHATGTSVGDATEIASMSEVFEGCRDVPLGSLKSNLGHLITAAGAAGLIKVLGALEHGLRPPTLHIAQPTPALQGSPFRLLSAPEPWTGPRRATVSAFGFGGNNAHLIVEAYAPGSHAPPATPQPAAPEPLAICAVGARVGPGSDAADLLAALHQPQPLGPARELVLPLTRLRFPPNDLTPALPQQLGLLLAALEASDAAPLPANSGVIIGMESDPEVSRYGARWRLPHWVKAWRAAGVEVGPRWLDQARESCVATLQAPGVLGTMPNIPANRVNSQLDLTGPSFTVSAGEASGALALALACRALRAHELDAAVVGAVDYSHQPVHQAALRALGDARSPGDAAVVLILRRLDDAQREGLPVLAVLDDSAQPDVSLGPDAWPQLGHAWAAHGLVQIAGAALCCASGRHPVRGTPWRGCVALSSGAHTFTLRAPATGVAVSSQPVPSGATRTLPAHWPAVALPALGARASQHMAPAPQLPPTSMDHPHQAPLTPSSGALVHPPTTATRPPPTQAPAPAAPHAAHAAHAATAAHTDAAFARFAAFQAQLSATHQAFLTQQTLLHHQFLALQHAGMAQLAGASLLPKASVATGSSALGLQAPTAPALHLQPPAPAPVVRTPAPVAAPAPAAPPPAPTPPAATPTATPAPTPTASSAPRPRLAADLPGPKYSREQLLIHASGRISELYGPDFAGQDDYHVQVRMPEPPLLLADRVLGIEAEPRSMARRGRIWTETDVRDDSWYLYNGHMPAGIMIESGQADLMLISWLGIDFFNQGDRRYRLLGCDLTYHAAPAGHVLPKLDETLQYEIHCDGHARHGDIRLFFFHYDCAIDGHPRLSVSGGQAGFFTNEELADSGGILWSADDPDQAVTSGRLDPPAVRCTRSNFSPEQIRAFSQGDAFACFGPGWELTRPHVRTPSIQPGKMCFLHTITHLDPEGGPWGRGYLRATTPVRPDDWFFDGHFKNDPCMPGTLMFEGCLQAMAFYLASLGFTIPRDGWRFEPLPGVKVPLRCRGQAIPSTRELIYEVFVREVHDGPEPTLVADLLCTIDGLKAFHAEAMGLVLVPGWPLDSGDAWIAQDIPGSDTFPVRQPGNVATAGSHVFDYRSLLACAWGRPSEAFGEGYRPFDGPRRVARLPGPPYHFMTEIRSVSGPIAQMKPGIEVEVIYEIPRSAYYFDQNGARVMPFAVLLEAALQPCGWLASYVGSALTTDVDLLFRNLDGTGTQLVELLPDGDTLRTTSTITAISPAGGMIIESFDVSCYIGDTKVYEMKTVFGFFPKEAFENQTGIVPDDDARRWVEADSDFSVDLAQEPARYCAGSLRLANPMLRMIDRVDGRWDQDGQIRLRARKDVDVSEWFFKCHFFQDPVQPGSLGIEAMIQLLQFHMLHEGMAEGMAQPRFEALAIGKPLTWKYRGQVTPRNKLITSEVIITDQGRDERGPYAVCDAWLWVDGLRIYGATGLAMRIVEGGPAISDDPDDGEVIELLDPASEPWLADHCPTWTLPALPAMSMVDRMAAAAAKTGPVHGLADVQVHRWLRLPHAVQLRTEVDGDNVTLLAWREAGDPTLSRFEPVCSGRVLRQALPIPAPFAPLNDGVPQPDAYDSGALFHGPALQRMSDWQLGASGASASLRADGPVPHGFWNQALLDAATHPIPHDSLHRWSADISNDLVAYPWRIQQIAVFGAMPRQGAVRCEVRFAGLQGERHPQVEVQLLVDGAVRAALTLVEVLLPKGPIGSAPPDQRRAFLRDHAYVPGLRLSRHDADASRLSVAEVRGSDWLEGTVAASWGLSPDHDAVTQVVAKEHVAAQAQVHPAEVRLAFGEQALHATPASLPVTSWPLTVAQQGSDTVVRGDGPQLELAPVRRFWQDWFQLGRWPVEDLYYGLIERFIGRVHLEDPEAFEALRGRPHLYLGNHQVMVESLLFSILVGGLNQLPTITLAKAEHRTTWMGTLIELCFRYPGCHDPEVITFFDRNDKRSLIGLIRRMGADMAAGKRSVLVHVEGTRALSSQHRVEKMSSAFIDMAINADTPLVPVRFSGALPLAPASERLDFPLGMGTQDIWIGRPIPPEVLSSTPLKARKEQVIAAINRLGPQDEAPHAPDPRFAAKVEAWVQQTGASQAHAVLLEVLRELPVAGEAVQRLVAAATSGSLQLSNSAEDQWLAELAGRLFGARGPQVRRP